MGFHVNAERKTVRVDLRSRGRLDRRRTLERLAPVGQEEPAPSDLLPVLALLGERVLDLEEVREIASRLDPERQVDRLLVMVEHRERLVEPLGDGPPATDGQLRGGVDRAGPGYEEEPRPEVVEVVGRERVEALAVHGQHPGGKDPGVEGEQAGRVGRGRLDVSAVVADDERVAVEDVDDVRTHRALRLFAGGPGRIRWNNVSSRGSPSTSIAPRSAAAVALTSPRAMPSKSALSARMTQSALRRARETEISPLSTETNHR